MHDVAAFLRAHPPFNSLDDETLARVAESAEIEFFAARSPMSTAYQRTRCARCCSGQTSCGS